MSTIMVIGSFSGHNFGDTVVLAATLQELDRRLGPETRYLVPTTNPGFLSARFENPRLTPVDIGSRRTGSYRFLGIPVLRALRATDVVVTTAGIFFDYRLLDPRFNFVSSLWPILRLARRSDIPIVGLNVGISSPTSRIGGHILGRVIGAHDYVSTRDRRSHELARGWLTRGRTSPAADTAHLLLGPHPKVAEREFLGVNAAAYLNQFDRSGAKPIDKRQFVEKLAANLDQIQIEHRVPVRLIATTPDDHSLHREISSCMRAAPQVTDIHRGSVPDGQAAFSDLAFFIGSRLHPCLFAASSGVPTLALKYHDKVADYMADLGLSRWVLTVEASMTAEIHERFRELVGDASRVTSALLLEQGKRYAAANAVFDRLAHMLEVGASREST
jgi:polysaccharide pyruvyl transferase WcaK-like protein